MELILILLVVGLLLYVFLIGQLIWGFNKVKTSNTKHSTPISGFTIIIPFRNEARHLPHLLESITRLNYPSEKIEIILIDDFSKDDSERICIQWRLKNEHLDTTLLKNLHLSNSPKKDAIGRAMPIAKYDWVITTDADCIVNKNWLITLDSYIQTNTVEMIVGAVIYKTKNNWFHHFQQLDLMSLQGVTIGSFGMGKPFMCNGANFAYSKNFFYKIGGFGGITEQASGDDVLLLQKAVEANKTGVHYLKHPDFIVETKPENDLYKLIMQRVRWAAKTASYKSNYAKFLAIVTLFTNFSLVLSFGFVIYGLLDLKVVLFLFLLKYCVDYILLYKSNAYLRKGKFFIPLASSIFYPIFSSWVGIYSLFGNYMWKGRTFKK